MSDEIKKAQKEAQRMAKELGLYEILRNIATNGSNHSEPSESKWGSCLIKYKVKEMGLGHLVNNDNSIKIPVGESNMIMMKLRNMVSFQDYMSYRLGDTTAENFRTHATYQVGATAKIKLYFGFMKSHLLGQG